MKCTGTFEQFYVDYFRKKQLVTVAVNEDVRQEYDRLKDKEKLTVEIKQYREKRSLSANSYFHVLVGKLADKLGTSNAYMKNTLLQRYGQLAIENDSIVPLVIRDDIDMMEREEMHLRPTDKVRCMDDGKLYRVYLLLRGSHTYDTEEMSRLIDGTVQECKEQGIETLTPAQLEEMKQKWGVEIG
ncbi:hypothetical protein [Extibacter muris]|uniref:Uncharacterized protein n=1 Tax=Extibacter muris TaxID=1796622 RepID=A0A4R4FE89_9FIRM|nr:hypothetical protein [Extibacter muris]MCU0079309.1 hypothetical protein [Extibacter muris]TDA21962.1 hypothetical protein E1963_09395 [Extibacter muris]